MTSSCSTCFISTPSAPLLPYSPSRSRIRSKPTWTCRKGRSSSTNSKSRPGGRGRAAKRTALYDAISVYTTHFRPLLHAELQAEQTDYASRLGANVSRKERLARGDALYGLVARKKDRLFANLVYVLTLPDNSLLPLSHRFAKADLIDIAPDRNAVEPVQGVVLSKTPRQLLVSFPMASEAILSMDDFVTSNTVLKAERGTNTLAYERAIEALDAFAEKGPGSSDIARLVVMSFMELSESQSHSFPPDDEVSPEQRHDLHGEDDILDLSKPSPDSIEIQKWNAFAKETVNAVTQHDLNAAMKFLPSTLNNSQRAAIKCGLRFRLTLLQGPPGTGKTLTTGYLIATAIRLRLGPVLACAASNVATDNLMRSVIHATNSYCKVVRIGRVSAVDEDLWDRSIDGILERNPQVRKARDDLARGALKYSELIDIERGVTATVLKGADVVLGTCVGCGVQELAKISFGMVIVDEATQATEPDVLIPLAIGLSITKKVVLVGDHHQLPPTVLSKKTSDLGLDTSLFLRLWKSGVDCELLDTQYRMHPSISKFPSHRFYFSRLQNGISGGDRPLKWQYETENTGSERPDNIRTMFFNVMDGLEESDSSTFDLGTRGKSYINKGEAKIVISLAKSLALQGKEGDGDHCGVPVKEIGLISPYSGQVRYIRDLATASKILGDAEVATIDGFQGREKDVIILSAVRSNLHDRIGFLRDWRRLNVAVTRARVLLIVVGNARTLRLDPHWNAWMKWVRKNGWVHDVNISKS